LGLLIPPIICVNIKIKNSLNIASISIFFGSEFQKINPRNKKKRMPEIIDLKKFIIRMRFNSGLEIKRISKLFALIEKHIKIYTNNTN
jgi:hypothetical protein